MKSAKYLIVLVATAALLLGSCSGGGFSGQGDGKTGTLLVQVDSSIAKNMLPAIGMECVSYEISGVGRSTTFGPITVVGDTPVAGLEPGSWDVTVVGYNGDTTPVAIGEGTETAVVTIGGSTNCAVSVVEYDGIGWLDILVNWEPDILVDTSVVAKLIDGAAVETALTFSVDNDLQTATYADIPPAGQATGFYGFVFKLLEGAGIAGGFADVVRIVNDQWTSATVDIDVNVDFGTISVLITSAIEDFLDLIVDVGPAAETTIEFGDDVSTETITLSGASTYVWYRNGSSFDAGDTIILDSSNYTIGTTVRLDCIGWNVAGTAAGALTWDILRYDPEVLSGSFMSGAAGDYAIKVLIGAVQEDEQTIVAAADTLYSFEFSGLTPSVDYRMKVTSFAPGGGEEFWEEDDGTSPTVFTYPLTELIVFDFGTVDF